MSVWSSDVCSFDLEVSVAPVRRGTAVELVYATGFVEPEQPVSVQARLTAPVPRVLADEGDRVRRGQALLALDDVDQRETVREAEIGRALCRHRGCQTT